jgi:hypothetical protein
VGVWTVPQGTFTIGNDMLPGFRILVAGIFAED